MARARIVFRRGHMAPSPGETPLPSQAERCARVAFAGVRACVHPPLAMAVLLLGLVPSTVLAQRETDNDAPGPLFTRPSIGVSFGASTPIRHDHADGLAIGAIGSAEAEPAVNFEFPLRAAAGLRTELGVATWAFDTARGWINARRETLTATRLTISYVRWAKEFSHFRFFWRVGGGYYHYGSSTSELDDPHRIGAHGGAGLEFRAGERFAVGGQLLQQLVPGGNPYPPGAIAVYTLNVLSAAAEVRLYF
jgi:hypothetical protein